MDDAGRSGQPAPGGHAPATSLFVPVRPARHCYVTCLFRTPGGRRTAVAFTSRARLLATLGPEQRWVRLSVTALRGLTAPLGCTTITVDPPVSVRPGSASFTTPPAPGGIRPGTRPDRMTEHGPRAVSGP